MLFIIFQGMPAHGRAGNAPPGDLHTHLAPVRTPVATLDFMTCINNRALKKSAALFN